MSRAKSTGSSDLAGDTVKHETRPSKSRQPTALLLAAQKPERLNPAMLGNA